MKVLGDGKHLRLVVRDGWEWAERVGSTGVVVLVAVTPGGELVLVEQDRVPVGKRVLELPAGLVGDEDGGEGEEMAEAARRELVEETGWDATSLVRLTEGPSSAGLTNEVVTFFRADGLVRRGAGGGVPGEEITVHEVPLAEAVRFVRAREREGVVVDPKVWAGLFFAGAAPDPA